AYIHVGDPWPESCARACTGTGGALGSASSYKAVFFVASLGLAGASRRRGLGCVPATRQTEGADRKKSDRQPPHRESDSRRDPASSPFSRLYIREEFCHGGRAHDARPRFRTGFDSDSG